MMRGKCLVLGVIAWCLGIVVATAVPPPLAVPAEFNYVGTYRLAKRVKLVKGETTPVAIRPLDYRVYTDGISVRLYGASLSDGYTSFTIYRNDGVVRRHSDTLVETVPGVQANSSVGQVMRQLCLTEETLTLTKFPAFSDLIEVTYAERLLELPLPVDESTAQNDLP